MSSQSNLLTKQSLDTSSNTITSGTSRAESFTGTDGDDYFDPAGGDDVIDGGAGNDTVLIFANKSHFQVITLEVLPNYMQTDTLELMITLTTQSH